MPQPNRVGQQLVISDKYYLTHTELVYSDLVMSLYTH